MTPKRVLVVEDNDLNLELITDILAVAGHEVITARDAETALNLVRTETPDLVLMDVQLPGMDGLEATRTLKADALTAHIPVVAVTSHAMKGDREKVEEAGCAGYFVKPISARTFAEEIGRFFRR